VEIYHPEGFNTDPATLCIKKVAREKGVVVMWFYFTKEEGEKRRILI